MKKKVLISIIGIILSLCMSINILSVYALSNDNVSMLFKEFITECFEDENNVIVFDGKLFYTVNFHIIQILEKLQIFMILY